MASNDYHFVTTWWIDATPHEIVEILGDPVDLARWWPCVYLDVSILEPGDERGIGRRIGLYTKGWLPYTLRWSFVVTESRGDAGFSLEASGDFVGRGIWTFEAEPHGLPRTRVVYDWRILAEKGVLKYASFLMKPIFAANHRWAMARGEESLRLELARRRAKTPEERAAVPQPPGPTFPQNLRPRRRPA